MCGITGAIWTDPSAALVRHVLERMTDVLRHRGPDDAGSYTTALVTRAAGGPLPGVALGIAGCRSSTWPVGISRWRTKTTRCGSSSTAKSTTITSCGSASKARATGFARARDTEVLVHLYEDEGIEFLRHLNGMFALAIWDARHGRFVLARDRLGKKPLYYRHEPRRLLFASELKSLLEVPDVERRIDPQALDEYLTYQYVPHPRTIFAGFCKLPPAHYAVFADGRLTIERYWHPELDREVNRPLADYVDELRELMTSAVRLRMEADVPLGAFLSGGVDSSLIVALMQRLSREPVKTFSIGFPVRGFDESDHARRVAERWGTDHHEFRVEPHAVEVLEKLVWHYDEPFADSSAIPTYYVSKLSRQHVTVALTGDGGDELFAGYDRYRAVRLAAALDRLPAWTRAAVTNRFVRRLADRGPQRSLARRLGRFGQALDFGPQRRYLEWVSMFNEARRADLYSEAFLRQLPDHDPFDFLADAFARVRHRDPVSAASLVDLVTYLPCDLMTKVDIASMANGLECRSPFLDYRLAELAAGMPLRYKMHRGRGKWILRKAFADVLPREVTARAKMGFGVPLAAWFRGELADFARDVLLDSQAAGRGYFRPGAVEELLAEHQTGAFDHGYRLWGLLVFELWHRTWLDGRPQPALAGSVSTRVTAR